MTDHSLRETGSGKQGDAKLLRLVYVSLIARPLSEDGFAKLSDQSRRHNASAGITGLLIAQDPFYYAVMEGPTVRLLARMEIIITDPRHRCLRILREDTLSVRRFCGWQIFHLPAFQDASKDQPPPAGFILELAQRLG